MKTMDEIREIVSSLIDKVRNGTADYKQVSALVRLIKAWFEVERIRVVEEGIRRVKKI